MCFCRFNPAATFPTKIPPPAIQFGLANEYSTIQAKEFCKVKKTLVKFTLVRKLLQILALSLKEKLRVVPGIADERLLVKLLIDKKQTLSWKKKCYQKLTSFPPKVQILVNGFFKP
jgi:hypothetical protein